MLHKGVWVRSVNYWQRYVSGTRKTRPRSLRTFHPDESFCSHEFDPVDLRQPLREVLRQCDEYAISSDHKSVENVFDHGSGAIVEILLRHYPQETAQAQEYGLLLQMAGAAGRHDFVQLLVERSVDVNATGSYYGTALQAACRFGHPEVVRQLLEAS